MSHVGWIDAREFARLGQVQEGRLPLAGLSRLAALLCDTGGEVEYRLQGSVDPRGNMGLELKVRTRVRVTCQRCLAAMELPLEVNNRFRLIDREPEWSAETAEIDAGDADEIVASATLDVAALIEDELLLALPLAPRHEHCNVASGGSENAGSDGTTGRESPFGVLARLKGRAAK
jgi:uncharacterized protein